MSNFTHKYGDWEITYVAGANEWHASHPDGRTKRSAQGLLALQAAIDKVATVEKKFERFDVFIFPRYHGDTVTKGTVTSYEGGQEARVSKASGERYGPKTKSESHASRLPVRDQRQERGTGARVSRGRGRSHEGTGASEQGADEARRSRAGRTRPPGEVGEGESLMPMTRYISVKRDDGTVVDVPYVATSPDDQRRAVSVYLRETTDWRPSEIAMHVATMSVARLRKFYVNLVLAGKVKQK
jgi:hypothetical protein